MTIATTDSPSLPHRWASWPRRAGHYTALLPLVAVIGSAPGAYADNAASAEQEQTAEEAFEAEVEQAMTEVMPLRPDEIRQLRERQQETEEAMSETAPQSMTSATELFSLEPGSQAPVLRLVHGYAQSIVIQDSSGAPWPIQSVTVGDDAAISLARPGSDEESPDPTTASMLTLTANEPYRTTNIVILLEGASAPLTVQLIGDDQSVSQDDSGEAVPSQLTLRAEQARGPEARDPEIGPSNGSVTDQAMVRFIDAAPPEDATRVKLEGDLDGIKAWRYDERLYVRTMYPLRWPAWSSEAVGHDDVRVYELAPTERLLVAVDGETHQVRVQGTLGEPDTAQYLDDAETQGETDTTTDDQPVR